MLINREWTCLRFYLTAFLMVSHCALSNADEQSHADAAEQATANAAPTSSVAGPSDAWHTSLTVYLWFPGTHGTLGNNGRTVDFRASAGDLFSNFRFGLMGAVQAQRGHFVVISDLVWVRLRATNTITLPFPGVPQLSAEAKAWQLMVTPEAGYRFLDREKVKIDALLGFRYWRVGASLQFTPSPLGLSFSGTRNWADPLMGARIQFPLSERALVTVLGDAGGWGAGAQLDYQVVGIIGFKVSRRITLGAGYRYLYVNYRPGSFVFDTTMSGPMVGLNYSFK